MRVVQSSRKLILAAMLTLIAFFVTNCAPTEIRKVAVQKADHYKFTSQQDGLRISVDPYTEKNRIKDSFGCDLLSRGILPVLVVVENLSSEDGYIMVIDKASLMISNAVNDNKQVGEDQKNYELERARKRAHSLDGIQPVMVLFPLLAFAVLPFAQTAENTYRNEVEIKRNLEQKLIVPKTIYQGGSHSGFLYFNLGKAEDISIVQGICLSIRNIRTNEISSITISTGKL